MLARHFAKGIRGDVRYMAFTGKAAMVMRTNGCHDASTIHSTIYNFSIDEETGVQRYKLKDVDELAAVKLFVIDECSMVDDELGNHILGFGIPILVLGDPAQLPPVRGNGFFTNVDPDIMLTEIHRQAQDNPIIQMATLIREGRRLDYGTFGDSRVISRGDLSQDDVMGADQVLVGLNKTRSDYNRRMRELHGRSSLLPETDDILVCLKNDRTIGIFNGGTWKVLEVAKRKIGHIDNMLDMWLMSQDFDKAAAVSVRVRKEHFTGGIEEVPWKELQGTQRFDYGYALTVHKAQGSQWGNVTVFDESMAFREDRARHLYTAITRASEKITVVM